MTKSAPTRRHNSDFAPALAVVATYVAPNKDLAICIA